ncbi:MAG TPA: ATP-binding protein [Deltaproteobacteria bacterium]|jgi:two-component system sensor histidine kinase HydH|nr:ATP-binding protein [Deltaproteobacteria bacterium]
MREKEADQNWIRLSPWVIIGAFVVFVPIFAFMTVKTVRTQQDNMIMLLREKGDALIRSFEAGTRTGMIGFHWSWVQVQRLIMETAEQPDILYILITDENGKIIAHNQPMHIGKAHGTELDRASIGEKIQSRRLKRADGKPIFEVYRKFIPSRARQFLQGKRITPEEWFLSHVFPEEYKQPNLIIFVGLDMDPIVKTTRENTLQSILIALILLMIGFSGIVSIIIAYNYRLARTSLSRIKAFSDNIVENMPVGLLFVGENHRIITMNNISEQMLKLSFEEARDKDTIDVLPPQVNELFGQAHKSPTVFIKEVDIPVHGKNMLFETSTSILRDEKESFLGYILLLRDITEIQHLKKEVLRKERLASLGSLAAGVAHEIRNPLSSIKGFATYFKDRYRDVPEDQKTADIMIKEVERLNRVVGQLLEFARPMDVVKKQVNLAETIRHSLEMIRSQAVTKGIRIVSDDVPAEPLYVHIDQDKIGQVLLNVYLNAMEAMDDGGTLKVRTENDPVNSNVIISVSDTGHGIPLQDLSRVFDPYFTTKQSGTGLGLAIVHKILEAHSGQIKITSTEEQGTTVSIILPVRGEE